MRNDKFWEECNNGSIRQKVAEFIDKNPTLSRLKGKEYYALEDSLVDFIEQNRNIISREVDLEYHRKDFVKHAKDIFGKSATEAIKVLPLDVIDTLIELWQDTLDDDDEYWDIIWSSFTDILTDGGVSPLVGIGEYPEVDVLIYAAYLKEWYSDMPEEMAGQAPACIDEFFNCEMEDEELREYYIKIATKMFGDKIKLNNDK